MMSAAQYYPKLLSIMGNVLRFLPAFVRMKELLEEGYIGELLVCEAQVCEIFFSGYLAICTNDKIEILSLEVRLSKSITQRAGM